MEDIYSIKTMYEHGKISQEQIDLETQEEMFNLLTKEIKESLKEIEKNEKEIYENERETERQNDEIEQIKQEIIGIRENIALMDKNSEMYKKQIAEMEKNEVVKAIVDKLENIE